MGSRPGEHRGGRKAGTPNKRTLEVQDLARQYAPAALEEAVRLATNAKSEQARTAAIGIILDRAYGRPPQGVTIQGKLNHAITVIKRVIVDLNEPEPEIAKIVDGTRDTD